MHNRSIRPNKFNPPSMRKLWKELGGYDALVEYNECAVRQFINKWNQVKETGKRYSEFLREESEDVGIHLGYIDIDLYRQDIYRWYLIHPYGCVENFVRDLKEDLKSFGFDINLDHTDKRPIERLIQGLEQAGINVSVEPFKLELDSYYHRFRNLIAHKLDKKEEEKTKRYFDKINKNEVAKSYKTLTAALSAPGILTFDDYTLCTANIKNIADTLITDVYLKIDWGNYVLDDLKSKIKTKPFSKEEKRVSGYIRQYISSLYGLTIDDGINNILLKNLIQSNNG